MNGKIYFNTLKDLAKFLSSFVGNTALFEVNQVGNQWILEFTGGY